MTVAGGKREIRPSLTQRVDAGWQGEEAMMTKGQPLPLTSRRLSGRGGRGRCRGASWIHIQTGVY